MAAQISSALKSRIARPSFLSKVMSPQDTVQFFHNGQAIGWSGFSPAGYPKVVPLAVADYVEKHNLQGKMRFDVFCGASTGVEVEDRWAALGLTRRRTPYISGDHIRKGVNTGKIQFKDTHLSNFAGALAYGHFSKQQVHTDEGGVDREFLAEANEPVEEEEHHEISAKSPAELVELWRQKKLEMEQKKNQKNISYPKQTIRTGGLDIGIIECTEILENGGLILGSGIGIAPEMAAKADKLILEVNTALPSFFGLHDNVSNDVPPFRKPYMIQRVDDRIGTPYLPIDPDKVVAVVESNMLDNGNKLEAPDAISRRIAGHLMDFFEHEVKVGRLPPQLLPLQSGVGNIANAVMAGLANGPFFNVRIWTEVLQDTVLDFFDSGRLEFASTAALSLSPQGFSRFYKNWDEYASKIVIRPQHISNHPEIVRRLGVIAMNTPVEVDIYAHANSTMVGGTKMVHGIGGSGDFIRNGYIPIMHTPSARATKNDPTGISCIVPKCSHIDHTEHDIYIVVTEQGLADLRGMSPRNRAVELIKKCAHPDYKDQLMDYFRYAEKVCLAQGAGHEPQILRLAFKMYENLEKKGSMKVDKWE